ncbi:aspartate aminotransferase family protein [Paenarthrobacter ureafaciens]|uniref:aspartate aminotransferase family protein n=1 Tax=Paenarthrobacter TaxID=1742992 RepID=UPI0015BF2758|nr:MULTISPECIES: aspartate aminotransferase family protein [Paenarthrobacter]NWL27201.1 aspartate aminotransferase family protein [Paenarthrobacter ureafaciens]QSZ53964.1 4-aminobutyrate aminotransferase [Paenarthrobacter ureafaciens]WOC62747.1 aspartate aminotransferase family protein [Paenarthrobacter sp. AT5]
MTTPSKTLRKPSQSMVNGFDPSRLNELPEPLQKNIRRRDQSLGPGYRLFYDEPLEIVRGKGVTLFDRDGNEYLDVYNNVPSVGHSHPRVIEAVHQQMQTLNTNTRYVQEPILEYSEQLLATFPAELGHVMFTCTGSEANDLAMRVAKYVTGSQGIIVTAGAYHGLTAEVSSFSPSLGVGVPLGPNVRVIDAPDALRYSSDTVSLEDHLREQVRAAIADLHRHGVGVAAFIADSIFSSDGVFSGPTGFLRPVVEEVHAAGGLYIADEVQPGFGRTGEEWWGFQRHGIVPDIVTIGKPMGNGIPVAAAIFKPELLVDFGKNIRYFNTFGGNSVAIAAAQAVLDVIREESLIPNALEVGNKIVSELKVLSQDLEQVAEVRGSGLFIGVDLVTDRSTLSPNGIAATEIVNSLRRDRILISACGAQGNVLKLRPPMPFSSNDADRLLEGMAKAFTTLR